MTIHEKALHLKVKQCIDEDSNVNIDRLEGLLVGYLDALIIHSEAAWLSKVDVQDIHLRSHGFMDLQWL